MGRDGARDIAGSSQISRRPSEYFDNPFSVVLDPAQEASPSLPFRLELGKAPGASTQELWGCGGPQAFWILVRLWAWLVSRPSD